MNGWRITLYRVIENQHAQVIMVANFPFDELYHANTIYNMLWKNADKIVMERVEEISTVFGSK
jgi:uncharacterized protein YaiI (UPF0178 family)